MGCWPMKGICKTDARINIFIGKTAFGSLKKKKFTIAIREKTDEPIIYEINNLFFKIISSFLRKNHCLKTNKKLQEILIEKG